MENTARWVTSISSHNTIEGVLEVLVVMLVAMCRLPVAHPK